MKKLLTLIAASLLTTAAATAAAPGDDFEVDDITYMINDDNATVTITDGYDGEVVVIPETVEYDGTTYTVTAIGEYAFYNYGDMTSVTIPETVESIGVWAFYCCGLLTSVDLPKCLTTLDYGAFYKCWSLTSVTIPESVEYMGECVFGGCTALKAFSGKCASEDGRCLIVDGVLNSFAPAGLTSYNIPDTVTEIGNDVFMRCVNLTSITIPASVTVIDDWAFGFCTGLTTLAIPASVTQIGKFAFTDCEAMESINIPPFVTEIGEGAFMRCGSLKTLKIGSDNPSDITLGERMFDGTTIENVTVYVPKGCIAEYKSASVWSEFTNFDELAYNFCEFNKEGTPVYYTVNDDSQSLSVSYGNEQTRTYSGEVVIPSTVDHRGDSYAVTAIGDYAFNTCTKLNSVEIPETVTSIGDYAFWACTALHSINLPSAVTTIGEHGFHGCSTLSSITLGENMESIGALAFAFCPSIKSMTVKTVDPNDIKMGEAVFANSNTSTSTLYVPKGSVEAYAEADQWKAFYPRVEGVDFSGIEDVVASPVLPADNVYYDMQGRRVARPTSGLYILNGRKVLVK